VVFFVVLLSAVIQGSTLPYFARLLKLEAEPEPEPPLSLEISSLRNVDAEIVDYAVPSASRAAGHTLSELALPEGAVVAMISRGKELIPPRGSTRILPDDHVFFVVNQEARGPVDRIFARARGDEQAPLISEFPLSGTATAGNLLELYDLQTGEPPNMTLEELIRHRKADAMVGTTVRVGGVRLRVREIVDGRISSVGLALPDENEHIPVPRA